MIHDTSLPTIPDDEERRKASPLIPKGIPCRPGGFAGWPLEMGWPLREPRVPIMGQAPEWGGSRTTRLGIAGFNSLLHALNPAPPTIPATTGSNIGRFTGARRHWGNKGPYDRVSGQHTTPSPGNTPNAEARRDDADCRSGGPSIWECGWHALTRRLLPCPGGTGGQEQDHDERFGLGKIREPKIGGTVDVVTAQWMWSRHSAEACVFPR